MKACRGNWNKGSHILNPDTKWKWLISVTLRSLICCRNNCLYSILQIRSSVGPRSSMNLVVKTGIPANDKKLTSDHPIMKGVLGLSGLKKCLAITWICFHTVPLSTYNEKSWAGCVCLYFTPGNIQQVSTKYDKESINYISVENLLFLAINPYFTTNSKWTISVLFI